MDIEKLKRKARERERRGKHAEALDFYRRAVRELATEDREDAQLHIRIGDIVARSGGTDEAVMHYEKALDIYAEEGLDNNAIAVGKKVLRLKPDRHAVLLRMGEVRARQGLVAEAREHLRAYADAMERENEGSKARRALQRLAELAPGDGEVQRRVGAKRERVG